MAGVQRTHGRDKRDCFTALSEVVYGAAQCRD
jgi:hypothetical protein